MDKITFHCEVVTPMFLAGADGVTPELRAPSIKGALRFWWRAMNADKEDMPGLETSIFGGSIKNEKGQIESYKSKVLIRSGLLEPNNAQDFNFVRDGGNFSEGIKYLHYPFYHHNTDRNGFAPGTGFFIEFKFSDRSVIFDVLKAFGVLSVLGGLGYRSRRGAGAFRIKEIVTAGISKSGTPFYREREGKLVRLNFVEFLKNLNLNKSKGARRLNYSDIISSTVTYKEIPGNLWQNAIGHIGEKMIQFRKQQGDGSPFTQDDLNKKAPFGLPINVRNEEESVNLFVITENGEREEKRRASPIYITVNMIKEKYYLTVTKLGGGFMDSSHVVAFYDLEWTANELDHSLLGDFWDAICDRDENYSTIQL